MRVKLPLLWPSSVVSLSIEGSSLRLLSCKGGRIQSWVSIPLNPRLLRGGFIADPLALSGVIRTAMEKAHLSPGRVIGGLTGLQSVSRLISLPKVAAGSLEAIVQREARRSLAISLEGNYLYWQALDGRGEELQVFVLAVPKEPLLAFLAALRGAGLRPRAIDLRPLALARAVAQPQAIIANAESNSVDVVVVVDAVPVLVHTSFLGDEPLPPEYVRDRLTDELLRAITFYNDTHRGSPLAPDIPLYLTGEMANETELVESIPALTGHPLAIPQPPLPYPAGFPLALYMVNIGLILKEV
ncbi:MAG: pilus assembly protein PilM [Chloroflexi bacterium]|nr:pilus assembly protein PilM [Chloroflexota bacterium]